MEVAFLPTLSTYGRPMALRDFGAFAVSLSVHAPREKVPHHRHEDDYQWCVVLEGGFEESAGRSQAYCRAGSFVVRPPDCVHADRFDSSRGLCLNIFPKGEWLAGTGLTALTDTYAHHRSRRLWRLGRAVAHELQVVDCAATPTAVEELVVELLASVVRLDALSDVGHPAWLRAVVDQIEGEPSGELRLSVLAREAGVSAAHLARSFRAAFGKPLGTYVRERRVVRAMALLRDTNRPIADIASAVGFCDQAHFTRAFRAHVGTTPAAYRAVN